MYSNRKRKLSNNAQSIYDFTLIGLNLDDKKIINDYLLEHEDEINNWESIYNYNILEKKKKKKNIFENYFDHIIQNSNNKELFISEKKLVQKCIKKCNTYNYNKTLTRYYFLFDISCRIYSKEPKLSDLFNSINISSQELQFYFHHQIYRLNHDRAEFQFFLLHILHHLKKYKLK